MKEFLMPEYYMDFRCKMGTCRSSCCEKWQVTLSLEDYFRLASVDCDKKLREKIDRGVKISLHPTPDAYAWIQHDYTGNCPMRLSDGRCEIHAEIGANALARVCKLYPRGLRKEPCYECSCANSCEATLELMFSKDEPIKFVKKQLEVELPTQTERTVKFDTQGKGQEIRLWLIKILQERDYSIPTRLMTLGLALRDLKTVLITKEINGINALIERPYEIKSVDFVANKQCLSFGLSTVERLLELIDERSDSVRSYGDEALKFFGNDEMSFNRYETAKVLFEKKIPKWEIWFEHMLVNHIFFEQFPFQDRPEDPWEEFVAICSVYAILRFLGIGCMSNKDKISDFVDMSAAFFRLVDHTSFDRYAARVLKELGCDTPQKIFDMVVL